MWREFTMKIVILDKCTVTKGDVDVSVFEKFGQVEYYDLLTKQEIIEALQGAEVVVCNKAVIDKEIIDSTNLGFIGLFATGYNNIDIEYAKQKGIVVCNVPGYSTDSVVQHTFSLLLQLAGNTSKYIDSVAAGDWKRSKKFSYFHSPISEISGKTLGIYGLGTIGIAVAKVALAFNMKVIAYTRTPKNFDSIELVDEKELFKQSDFLTIHCPLNNQTAEIINKNTLALMKKDAYLVNTSRGGVINEYDLAQALKNNVIAGAALDVLTYEPMAEDCPLFDIDNCLITPHIAWAAFESRTRLIDLVCDNISAYISGKPINVVNK